MTWAMIGATLIATVGSVGGAAASGALSEGGGVQPPQPGMMPEKQGTPYKSSAAQFQKPPMPAGTGQVPPIPTPGQLPPPTGAAGQLPNPMDLEEMKRMYGIM